MGFGCLCRRGGPRFAGRARGPGRAVRRDYGGVARARQGSQRRQLSARFATSANFRPRIPRHVGWWYPFAMKDCQRTPRLLLKAVVPTPVCAVGGNESLALG